METTCSVKLIVSRPACPALLSSMPAASCASLKFSLEKVDQSRLRAMSSHHSELSGLNSEWWLDMANLSVAGF